MSSHDSQAAYEHKLFLLQLSDKLTKGNIQKILFLVADLPKAELEGKSPLEVLAHLEMLGKTSTEELSRILKDIGRQDLVKKLIQKEAKNRKTPLSRKDSGPSALKLEDNITLAVKHCELLIENVEHIKQAASKGGKKRVEELCSEMKAVLSNQVHRKLKYASGLLTSESTAAETERCIKAGEETSQNSPPSSPESSITLLRGGESPPSPVRLGARLVKESDLRKGRENLKSPKQRGSPPRQQTSDAIYSNETVIPADTKQGAHNAPMYPTQPVDACDDEDIYTLPGPPVATSSASRISDGVYYNIATSSRDSPPTSPGSNKQASQSTFLVTGTSKVVKPLTSKKPAPPPKPSRKIKMQTSERLDEFESPMDDSSSTFTDHDDSGFADSRDFRKEDPPAPVMPHQNVLAQQTSLDSGATYAALIQENVQPPGPYMSAKKRDNIPDVVYEERSSLSTN